MAKGDKYILLRTANVEWWDVIYYNYRERPDKRFYVPAKYVRPLDIIFNEGDCDHEGKLIVWVEIDIFLYLVIICNKF